MSLESELKAQNDALAECLYAAKTTIDRTRVILRSFIENEKGVPVSEILIRYEDGSECWRGLEFSKDEIAKTVADLFPVNEELLQELDSMEEMALVAAMAWYCIPDEVVKRVVQQQQYVEMTIRTELKRRRCQKE